MTQAAFNLEEALANLDALQPGKRHRPPADLGKIIERVRKARARGATWTSIVAGLKAAGMPISVARLKSLVEPQQEKDEVGHHPGAPA